MADWDFSVEGSQGTAESGGGVTLNEDDVWFFFGKYGFEGADDTRRGLIKGLPRAHDVEVPVWSYVECVQNLIQHLAVLRSDADTDIEVIRQGLHVPDYRTKFNGLGASAENEEHFY